MISGQQPVTPQLPAGGKASKPDQEIGKQKKEEQQKEKPERKKTPTRKKNIFFASDFDTEKE